MNYSINLMHLSSCLNGVVRKDNQRWTASRKWLFLTWQLEGSLIHHTNIAFWFKNMMYGCRVCSSTDWGHDPLMIYGGMDSSLELTLFNLSDSSGSWPMVLCIQAKTHKCKFVARHVYSDNKQHGKLDLTLKSNQRTENSPISPSKKEHLSLKYMMRLHLHDSEKKNTGPMNNQKRHN